MLALSLIAGMGALGVAISPMARASNPSCVGFDSQAEATPVGLMDCDVPAGVTSLNVTATGAGGGGGGGDRTSTGGDGAVVVTALTVVPGETLTLEVGTGGTATLAPAGGGGGGWSAVKRSTTALVIGGGGGGGGSVDGNNSVLAPSIVLAGGNAGGPAAADGSPHIVYPAGGDQVYSGSGASTTAGGAGGAGPNSLLDGVGGGAGQGGAGQDGCSYGGAYGGSGWQGGAAQTSCGASGGGGGSGAFGGGGGGAALGNAWAGGSGGGGSSAVAAGSASYSLAGNGGADHAAGGDGRIQLSAPAPTITSIAPATGSTGGGTSVTVTGTHFTGGTTVSIGGHACTSVTVNSSTSLTCSAPAGPLGAANVVVTSFGQSDTLTGGYTYVVPPVPVVSVVPAPGTPASVVATSGVSSLTVTWAAPISGGPVTRYEVRTAQGAAICTTTTTTCVLGAEAGAAYLVTVVAIGPGGTGPAGQATSGTVAPPVVPTSVPADASLTLTTDKGRITRADPGQNIIVIGTGFAPYSTATVIIYSTPTVLGTVVTDGSGNFSKPVTVPADLAAGTHDLVAAGVDPLGATRTLRMEVAVGTGGPVTSTTGSDPSTTGSDPSTTGSTRATTRSSSATTGSGSATSRSALAWTGFSASTPLALSALFLASGIGLAWIGRRRADV